MPDVSLPTTYQVVDANTLKPATGDLQPRDRAGRASSEAQIAENASRLDPGQITASPVADYGAPVVTQDGTVLAGNGRLATIQRAAELHPEKYQAYRAELERLGHDTTGMTTPVLVRRAGDITPEQARAFAEASNVTRAMGMSPVEQAKVDARNLTDGSLAKYDPAVPLTHGKNLPFIRDWIGSLPPTERNALVDAKGQLSQQGIQRLQGAVLAKAYNHDPILRRALESPNDDVKSITNSLMDVAAPWVKMKSEIAADRIPAAFDITKNMTEALDLISQARTKGISPGDMLKQGDVFSGAVDPVTEQIIRTFYNDRLDRLRSRTGISNALGDYVEQALDFRPGKDLLGHETVPDPAFALEQARTGKQAVLVDKALPGASADAELDFTPDTGAPAARETTTPSAARVPQTQLERLTAHRDYLESLPPSSRPEDRAALARAQRQVDALRDKQGLPAEDRPATLPERRMEAERRAGKKLPFKGPPEVGGKPDFIDYKFNNGTSVYRSVFEQAGHDPNLAVNKPIEWQNQVLTRHMENTFGFRDVRLADDATPVDAKIIRDAMLDATRAMQDMMASEGQPYEAASLHGRLTLVFDPEGKRAYYGRYAPGLAPVLAKFVSLAGPTRFGHEWTHAVDHLLADQLSGQPLTRNRLLTQYARAGQLDPKDGVQGAFARVLNTLFYDKSAQALREMDLTTKAAAVDRQGNPTKGAMEARRQLDLLERAGSRLRIAPSEFRRSSVEFAPQASDYYAHPAELLARAHEAYLARQMQNNGVDPRGVVMPDEAYINETDRALKMLYPKAEDRMAIFKAFDDLHAAMRNDQVLSEGKPPGAFPNLGISDPRHFAITAPNMADSAIAGDVRSTNSRWANLTRNLLSAHVFDPNRPSPGELSLSRRTADVFRSLTYSDHGIMETIIKRAPKQAQPYLQTILDRLTPSPGERRYAGESLEEAVRRRSTDWSNRFANMLRSAGYKDANAIPAEHDAMIRHVLVSGENRYPPDPK